MQIIYQPRQSGKTTKMIEWLKESKKNLLLVPHLVRKAQLVEENPKLKNQIMTLHEYLPSPSAAYKKVSVDDAELVLQSLLKHRIEYITMSIIKEGEGEIKRPRKNNVV